MWILGQGGFFGSALSRQATEFGFSVFPTAGIQWTDPQRRVSDLSTLAFQFANFALGTLPTIVWAAGASGVAGAKSKDHGEVESFRDFVKAVTAVESLESSAITIISSAGGVYGGSGNPPFDIHSPTSAINQYGADKMEIEQITQTELVPHFAVHIARLTNLYGPWPGSRQGLINRLCTAAATREAIQIYVPLDTVRDYIYIEDAAKLLLLELQATRAYRGSGNPTFALVGSGENVSVGAAINTVSQVARRRIPVTVAILEETALQPRDLRMNPSWYQRGVDFSPLTLSQGTKRLFDSLVTVPRWT